MDVFQLRDGLVKDYSNYIKSFISIHDDRIRQHVDHELASGTLRPDPSPDHPWAEEYLAPYIPPEEWWQEEEWRVESGEGRARTESGRGETAGQPAQEEATKVVILIGETDEDETVREDARKAHFPGNFLVSGEIREQKFPGK